MVYDPDVTNLTRKGVSAPGVQLVRPRRNPDYIFVQNDTGTNPTLPHYVTQVDGTHYTMLNATAPKTGQYLGAFLWDGATNTRGSRTGAGTTWTTSDSSVVSVSSVTASGQAIVSILKAGTATLTVRYNGMTSTLVIKAT